LIIAIHDGPELLFTLFRIGANASVCDKWTAGGIMVAIDTETGTLQTEGFLEPGCGTRVTSHPQTGAKYEGFRIPFYQEAVALVLRAHEFWYGVHKIGWDFAITEKGSCIVEANNGFGPSTAQALNDGDTQELFGRLSEGSHSIISVVISEQCLFL
jgi:hypothetical protein